MGADTCADDRFPRVVGTWVLHCSSSGRVDRALHVVTGEELTLTDAVVAPGFSAATDGSASLFDPTVGWWTLPAAGPRHAGGVAGGGPPAPGGATEASAAVTPSPMRGLTGPFAGPAGTSSGAQAVVLWPRSGSTAARAEIVPRVGLGSVRVRTDAHPLAGAAAVAVDLTGPDVATGRPRTLGVWVEDAGTDGFDLVGTLGDGVRIAIATGAGDAWRPAASGPYLAWVETGVPGQPDAVVVLDAARDTRKRYPAKTGFLSAPALDGPVACWEERPPLGCPGDVDIRCSDGITAGGPGDQLAPSRSAGRLVFRERRTVRWMQVPTGDAGGSAEVAAADAATADR